MNFLGVHIFEPQPPDPPLHLSDPQKSWGDSGPKRYKSTVRSAAVTAPMSDLQPFPECMCCT